MRAPYGIERAIEQGIDDARLHRKDPPELRYHMKHPLFQFWWTALVAKADCRDWSDRRIREKVLNEVRPRGL